MNSSLVSCRNCGKPLNRGRLCKDCRKLYDRGHFNRNKEAKITSVTQRKRELLEWYRSLKTGKSCFDCGGVFHFCAMDFDHMEGHNKVDEISHMVRVGMSKERILDELKKTVLLCANCHRVRTFMRLKGKSYGHR